MRKYFYIVFVLLLGACSRYSEDAARHMVLADVLMESQPDSALRVLQTIESPEELNAEQYARHCLLLTTAKDMMQESLTTDSLIKVAVKFFERNPERYPAEAVKASYYMARVYQDTGREDEAMGMYLKLEPRAEILKDNNLLGLLNSWMGRLFRRQNHIEQSIERYRKSAGYFKQTNNRRNEGYALSNMGYDYIYLKQYDSSIVYCQKARQIAQEIKDTLLLSDVLMQLGIAYDFLGKSDAVKLYLLEATQYEKMDRNLIQAYNYLAGAYFKDHQYETARFYANYALQMSEKSSLGSYKVYGLCNSTWHLYNIALEEGKLQVALDYYDQYSEAKDSIAALEVRNNVLAVQEKYKAEEFKAENLRLRADRETERFNQMLGIFIASFVIMILLLARGWHQRNILKQKELMLRKEARLKNFLLKRLDVSKEIVAMAQYPASDAEKLQQKFKLLVESLSFKLSDQRELETTVNELYDNFADKLAEQYPQMTNDEVQLCCMVRCGFDAGLMATAMGVNLDTVYKKRSRLRKKINLDRDEDFESFLHKF